MEVGVELRAKRVAEMKLADSNSKVFCFSCIDISESRKTEDRRQMDKAACTFSKSQDCTS